jgi:hypothetical protein
MKVLGRRLAVLALVLLALAGCGSSTTDSAKQARIATALRKLEREFIAGRKEAPHEFHGEDVLGSLTLVYSPAPRGVSEAEWNAAIQHDKRLQRLKQEEPPRPPERLTAHHIAEVEAGKRAVLQSGCLACHKIGDNGNTGPGPDLTEVGARLPRQAIERTLIAPTAPMPSFKNLPPAKFQAIVTFLAALK